MGLSPTKGMISIIQSCICNVKMYERVTFIHDARKKMITAKKKTDA